MASSSNLSLSSSTTIFPLLADDALALDNMMEEFLISSKKDICRPFASRICITALRALDHFKEARTAREEMGKIFDNIIFPKIKAEALAYAKTASSLALEGEGNLLECSRRLHYGEAIRKIENNDFDQIILIIREATYERFGIETFSMEEQETNVKAKYAMTKMATTRDVERVLKLFKNRLYDESVIDALFPKKNRYGEMGQAAVSPSSSSSSLDQVERK